MPSPENQAVTVRSATDADVRRLITFWDACNLTRPHNHAPTDIHFARRGPNSDVLVLKQGDEIIASAMVGHDGHRGWVYYVAVDPARQRRGLGTRIMAEAENWLHARGVWKIHLMVRSSNAPTQSFYQSIGYGNDDVTVLSKRLRPMPHVDPDAP